MDFFLYAPFNPQNVGSIVRASVNLGLDKFFIYDKYNLLTNSDSLKKIEKVARLDRVDRVEIINVNEPLEFVESYNTKYITSTGKCSNKLGLDGFRFERENSVIVFGNESEGIPREISRPHGRIKVTIPNFSRPSKTNLECDCQNLGMAFGIILYEYMRQGYDSTKFL